MTPVGGALEVPGAVSAAALDRLRRVVAVLVAVFRVIIGPFGGHQRLTVLDGDPVIVRVDFAEGEEALAVAAIFDKCRLQ